MSLCVRRCKYVCVHVNACVCVNAYVYACVCVYMCVCLSVYVRTDVFVIKYTAVSESKPNGPRFTQSHRRPQYTGNQITNLAPDLCGRLSMRLIRSALVNTYQH